MHGMQQHHERQAEPGIECIIITSATYIQRVHLIDMRSNMRAVMLSSSALRPHKSDSRRAWPCCHVPPRCSSNWLALAVSRGNSLRRLRRWSMASNREVSSSQILPDSTKSLTTVSSAYKHPTRQN